jgi:hypothetical protein
MGGKDPVSDTQSVDDDDASSVHSELQLPLTQGDQATLGKPRTRAQSTGGSASSSGIDQGPKKKAKRSKKSSGAPTTANRLSSLEVSMEDVQDGMLNLQSMMQAIADCSLAMRRQMEGSGPVSQEQENDPRGETFSSSNQSTTPAAPAPWNTFASMGARKGVLSTPPTDTPAAPPRQQDNRVPAMNRTAGATAAAAGVAAFSSAVPVASSSQHPSVPMEPAQLAHILQQLCAAQAPIRSTGPPPTPTTAPSPAAVAGGALQPGVSAAGGTYFTGYPGPAAPTNAPSTAAVAGAALQTSGSGAGGPYLTGYSGTAAPTAHQGISFAAGAYPIGPVAPAAPPQPSLSATQASFQTVVQDLYNPTGKVPTALPWVGPAFQVEKRGFQGFYEDPPATRPHWVLGSPEERQYWQRQLAVVSNAEWQNVLSGKVSSFPAYLVSMMKHSQESGQKKVSLDASNSFTVTEFKPRLNSPLNFLEAYTVYAAANIVIFPERVLEMLGYQLQLIRLLRKHAFANVMSYDMHKRTQCQVGMESLLFNDPYMYDMFLRESFTSEHCRFCGRIHDHALPCETELPGSATDACRRFNDSFCTSTRCTYPHRCSSCSSVEHGRQKCPTLTRGSAGAASGAQPQPHQ